MGVKVLAHKEPARPDLGEVSGWPNNTLLTYTLPADGQGEGERGRYAHNSQLPHTLHTPKDFQT